MSTQNISTTTFRSSFLLTLATAALVVLTISCSDLSSEDGITNTEFQEAQSQITEQSSEEQPLLFLNGERIKQTGGKVDIVSRIKSEYIYSVNILKGQNATDAYGKSGQNGVVKIQLHDGIDIETVLSDLKPRSTPKGDSNSKDQGNFFVAVEQMPELVGGLAELQKKINYPEEAKEAGIEGRVIVQFIVNEQGNVEDPQIIRGIGGGADQEALRVVKQAKFKPGRQRGQAVRVQYSLPIIYRLPSSITKQEPTADVETPKVEGATMKLQKIQTHNGTLSGKVVSVKDNAPLAGANVIITGTNKGTSTDQNGEFSIQGLSEGTHNLTISYVGYQPSEGTITIQ